MDDDDRQALTADVAEPPEKNIATMPPTAAAADSAPTVLAPPPKITAPAAGNSTRGWASSIAAMSATNVMRTLGRGAEEREPVEHRAQSRAARCRALLRRLGRQGRQPGQPPERGGGDDARRSCRPP